LPNETAGTAQADITLHLDAEGIIRDASLSNSLSDESIQAWVGRPWSDTIADGEVSTDKVKRIFDDIRSSGVSAFRQLTQCFPSGRELPMEYTTVRRNAESGLIAIGKSLQTVAELHSRLINAQQTMERDYWKLREIETRYRLVFDASQEAVLLVRATDLCIVEANPAAARLMGSEPGKAAQLMGTGLVEELAVEERERFQAMLLRVREQGKAPGMLVHLGRDRQPSMVRASLMNAQSGLVYLLQLAPVGAAMQEPSPAPSYSVDELLERGPDGFVVIDREGEIVRANRAFLDLIQIGAEGFALGEPLSRWLGRPGADLTVLLATIQKHGVVRLFSTTLHGELDTDTAVELSAVGDRTDKPAYISILMRDVSRRLTVPDNDNRLNHALGSLTEQVGKSTLRKLVGDAGAGVARPYIEAALELTEGNRTAAAELLGLSRQSLYAKLNRYGFEMDSHATSERTG